MEFSKLNTIPLLSRGILKNNSHPKCTVGSLECSRIVDMRKIDFIHQQILMKPDIIYYSIFMQPVLPALFNRYRSNSHND